jgi:HD-GYP domain-containing protein (c-di-GMP phosphodiesterase class II)
MFPVAVLATSMALIAAYASVRVKDVRLFWLTIGFLAMGAIFAVHGLATPGMFLASHHFGTVGLSSYLALGVGAPFLLLSTLELPLRLRSLIARHLAQLLIFAIFALIAFGVVVLAFADIFDHVSLQQRTSSGITKSSLSWTLTAVTLGILGLAAYRTFKSYLLSKSPMQGSIVASLALLMHAQGSLQLPVNSIGWWFYHLYLILAFGMVLYALIGEYAGGRSLTETVRELVPSDVLDEIKHGLEDSVVALAAAAEARDSYTYDHISRVGELSVCIGQAMGLSNLRLRSLAQGAMLHDIGKLYVSDTVLMKPDKLTSDEYTNVTQHPVLGYDLLARLRGFSREALIVKHHHEWWDGSGYPDGLKEEEIPLEARIVAVADVYDALTTDRPYRPALAHEEAIAQIEKEAGTHLDPNCVDAFLRIVDDWRLRQHPAKPASTVSS